MMKRWQLLCRLINRTRLILTYGTGGYCLLLLARTFFHLVAVCSAGFDDTPVVLDCIYLNLAGRRLYQGQPLSENQTQHQ